MAADEVRVLVVEDDPPIRKLVTRTLGRLGYFCDEAEDGAIAIEKLKEGRYDVMVLDLMMPRVDGFGVLEYLSQHDSGLIGRTIITTAVPPEEVRRKLQYPVARVLSKPFDLQALMDAAQTCSAAN